MATRTRVRPGARRRRREPTTPYNSYLGLKLAHGAVDKRGFIGNETLAELVEAVALRTGHDPQRLRSWQVKRMLTFAAAEMPPDFMIETLTGGAE